MSTEHDTLPPTPGFAPGGLAPEVIEKLLSRVHATVEDASLAAQRALEAADLAKSAAARNTDALIEHVSKEHQWMGRIERNLDMLAERQRMIPTLALVLSGVSVVVALVALVASLWVSTRIWSLGFADGHGGATSGQRLAVEPRRVIGSRGAAP